MKTIKIGEAAPRGVYRRIGWDICFRIPLFIWYGTFYDVVNDTLFTGWKTFELGVMYKKEGIARTIKWFIG